MTRLFASLAIGAVVAVTTPVVARAQDTTAAVEAPIVAEARAFMETYAEDLRAGDRAALAARYDRSGMVWVRAGEVEPMAHEPLTAMYMGEWRGPAAFEWRDLTFIPAGPDAVVVIGRFHWTGQSGSSILVAYHNLLVRQDGELRIRIEDETPVSEPPAE